MIKRLFTFSVYLVVDLLFLPLSTLAYELLQPGTRANSLGGAFIGISDDWSAIYWNPAGLMQSLDRELSVEGEYLSLYIKDGDSIANGRGIFSYRLPGEKERFSKEAISQAHYLPSIGFVLPMKGLVLGFGIYPRLYDYLDWEDKDTPEIRASLKRRTQIYNGGLILSTHIAPVIYAGAGLNMLYSEYELLAEKEYKGINPYDFKYHLNQSSGTGLEVVLGGLYQPQQLFSMGVVYRSGGTISLRGSAQASRGSERENSSYTKRVYLPPSFGIGLGIRYIPKTTIGLDWSRLGWDSWREDYSLEREGEILKNPKEDEKDPGWKGADRWHLGFEIRPNGRLKLMLGSFYNQSPLSDSKVDLVNGMVEMDRLGVSGGLGYKVGNWGFDLGCLWSNAQTEVDDVGYQRNLSKAQILIKTHFF